MRYLISGITGARNRGVEALLIGAIEGIRSFDPGAQFTIATGDADYDAYRFGSPQIQVLDHAHPLFSPGLKGAKAWMRRSAFKSGRPYHKMVEAIDRADAIIASGGDVFASEYGSEILGRHLNILHEGLARGKKVAFLAHSIGPFKKDADLRSWLDVADRCHLVTLRESLSHEYVRQHCRLPEALVQSTADVAFLMSPAKNANLLLEQAGIPEGAPLVACSISSGIAGFAKVDGSGHPAAWQTVIEGLVRDCGAHVLLIPHVQEVPTQHDDGILGLKIVRQLPLDIARRVRVLAGDYRAPEYKAIISRCQMLVAERMHAAIAGLSTGVATLVIGYSVKARGIVKDLLGSESAQDGTLLPVADFLNADLRRAAVSRCWDNREAIAAKLRAARPANEERARRNFALLAQAVGAAGRPSPAA